MDSSEPCWGPPGTPWGHPRDPGHEIADSGIDVGSYLKPNWYKIDAQRVPEGNIQAIL